MDHFLRILSWNMCGNGSKKIAYIQPYRDSQVVLVCQESGNPYKEEGLQQGHTYGDYVCLGAFKDEAAKNLRCTTSVLISCKACSAYGTQSCRQCDVGNHMHASYFYITNRVNIITRPCVKITYNRKIQIDIYTYHATANGFSSTVEIIEIINAIAKENNPNKRWILIGDFNANPEDFADHKCNKYDKLKPQHFIPFEFLGKSLDGSPQKNLCFMLYPNGFTQRSCNTFDYAFVSPQIVNDNIIFDIANIPVKDNNNCYLSDHNCISLLLNLRKFI